MEKQRILDTQRSGEIAGMDSEKYKTTIRVPETGD